MLAETNDVAILLWLPSCLKHLIQMKWMEGKEHKWIGYSHHSTVRYSCTTRRDWILFLLTGGCGGVVWRLWPAGCTGV